MNFLITYTAYNLNGEVIKSGKMRAKNKFNEFDAKCGLEKHLKKVYPNMFKLVIHTCEQDFDLGIFGDLFNKF